MRELLEETGLKIELGDVLDLSAKGAKGGKEGEGEDGKGEEGEEDEYGDTPLRQYSVNPYKTIGKETRFWVGVVRGEQEVRLQTEEVDEYRWCGWEEAMGCITFEDARGVLRMVVGLMGQVKIWCGKAGYCFGENEEVLGESKFVFGRIGIDGLASSS